jgi:hypothetical protein
MEWDEREGGSRMTHFKQRMVSQQNWGKFETKPFERKI